MKSDQDKLIGRHPNPPCVFQDWLSHVDYKTTPIKRHRSLTENVAKRQSFIKKLAVWIVKHHVTKENLERLKKKRKILEKYGYQNYLSGLRLLPTDDKTKKGNATEIILFEYLKSSTALDLFFHRFHYNGNVNQSMKGDDVLFLNRSDLYEKIIIGEAKYRSVPSKTVIEEIASNLDINKLPTSLPLMATHYDKIGEKKIANEIMELLSQMHSIKLNIVSSGLLMSTTSTTPSKDTKSQVEKHLNSNNLNLIFLSLGLDNPESIIDSAFSEAEKILNEVDSLPEELKSSFFFELKNLISIDSIATLIRKLKNANRDR
ncbi:MAG TPA: Hachiman antiphage defense system protein HamA [Bacteroidia bacterium]|nr:Hachiman antiphage defense system protein HamA [Bacteroidia bacterium]